MASCLFVPGCSDINHATTDPQESNVTSVTVETSWVGCIVIGVNITPTSTPSTLDLMGEELASAFALIQSAERRLPYGHPLINNFRDLLSEVTIIRGRVAGANETFKMQV